METPPLPGNDSNLEPSSATAGNSHAPASTAESSEELKRLTALGTLLVNMGAASEEKIFGVKDSAPMLAYRQNRLHELLVINRPQDDAAAHMFIWYKPWTWWSSGAQVSPIVVKRMLTEEGSADAPRTTAPPQTPGSTQTEADEVDALTPAVRDERAKLLLSEKHIHETLQGMEDTRYRYLVPSHDLKCEAEVMDVVRCYAERNQAKAASLAAEGGRAPPGAAATSHNRLSGGGEKAVVRADLLACGPHVQRLKTCAESMVMQYSREGKVA
ncbi:hypothetical protein CGC20_35390 [Leishmania donovani]|uniref:Uncharacterized protein n=1 Tax=Leishmania donovani TaxID=5661 RepID=A0A504XCG3_LEIDO|nr:hypothetical protein CGC21_3545 [Leishmania donovani]TPP43920.1 hypothetical protein CGC20_35390 [Leishmania donovani]